MAIIKCPKCNGTGEITDDGKKIVETVLFGGANLLFDIASDEDSYSETCGTCRGKGVLRD